MLNVIFISRCSGSALGRTRHVLDAYAKRIGDFSWETNITQIGLDTVRRALRRKASRKTAICCHIITRKGRKLAWIVGNRKQFAQDGSCAVRLTGKIHEALKTRRNFKGYPLIAILAETAARGHDLGKANKFFQEKVKRAKKVADPFRHEFLSMLLIEKIRSSDNFKNVWKESVSVPQKRCERWKKTFCSRFAGIGYKPL